MRNRETELMSETTFANAQVKAKFMAYPPKVRKRMLDLRELILRTAQATDGVGEIEETLKWGEPAYVTRNNQGSTVRIDWKPKHPERYAMYFNCNTRLVETFRTLFPDDFSFEGNRALVFGLDEVIPEDSLSFCVAASLTYHRNRRQGRKSAEAKKK